MHIEISTKHYALLVGLGEEQSCTTATALANLLDSHFATSKVSAPTQAAKEVVVDGNKLARDLYNQHMLDELPKREKAARIAEALAKEKAVKDAEFKAELRRTLIEAQIELSHMG
jgi:hypothetical protein